MTARRTLLVTLTAALTAASVYLALSRWAAGDLATLVRETGREDTLARQLVTARHFSDTKHRAVADLIAGRITLREAAARFQEMDAFLDGGKLPRPSEVTAGEEPLCRMVYSWAAAHLRDRPEAAAVLARLAAEYREQFGHDPQPLPGYELPLTPGPSPQPSLWPPGTPAAGPVLPGLMPLLRSWAG